MPIPTPEPRTTVYISLGSNIAPQANILRAVKLLTDYIEIAQVSTFFLTEPIGSAPQPAYINGVLQCLCSQPARNLKYHVLRAVEHRLGRMRTADKYAPRPIDLDILLYGTSVVDEVGLTIPDPHLRSRAFICRGLLELNAEIVLPDTGERLKDVCSRATHGKMVAVPELTETCREEIDQ